MTLYLLTVGLWTLGVFVAALTWSRSERAIYVGCGLGAVLGVALWLGAAGGVRELLGPVLIFALCVPFGAVLASLGTGLARLLRQGECRAQLCVLLFLFVPLVVLGRDLYLGAHAYAAAGLQEVGHELAAAHDAGPDWSRVNDARSRGRSIADTLGRRGMDAVLEAELLSYGALAQAEFRRLERPVCRLDGRPDGEGPEAQAQVLALQSVAQLLVDRGAAVSQGFKTRCLILQIVPGLLPD